MKLTDLLTEQELDELGRRDFLKGLAGLAAGAAGVKSADAATFQKSTDIDKMSGEKTEYRDLDSDDGKASLSVIPNKAVILVLKKGRTFIRELGGISVRIKFGNNPVTGAGGIGGGTNQASLGIGYKKGGKDLANDILKHKGTLLIEVTLDDGQKDIIKFTID
jgi:hypothetical protein